jgi:glycerate 2-kinase
VLTIARGAIDQASPRHLLDRALQEPEIASRLKGRVLRVIAVGKAAPFMAHAFAEHVGGHLREGIVIGTHLPIALPPHFTWMPSSHPLPDEHSVSAGRRALELARHTPPDETLVVLLSGGASALMAVPAADLTIEDKRTTVNALLRGGADITQLNTVRKHLSAVKGGRLAAAAPGPTVCLAISDVVGDDVSVIGSGPTVPDPSTYRDAWGYVVQLGLKDRLSPAVSAYLQAGVEGRLEETPKPGDARLERSITRVIGGRMNAMEGAREAARSLGYDAVIVNDAIVGEARTVAPALLERARALASGRTGPLCVIASGETTVKVVGTGKGGRNQEMALAAAAPLAADGRRADTAVASIGTDGIDGPTDAAGALADSTTMSRATQRSLDPAAYLADNNAYAFFAALDDLIITGPTTTNVGDVQIILFSDLKVKS